MNFEEFINTIKDTIKEYLPEDYRDAEVNILENRKLNHRRVHSPMLAS